MADEIDDALLAVVGEHWRKVAMVLLKAEDKLGWDIDRDGRDEDFHRIAERLKALVAGGHLEAQGDLSLWRHSEVRRIAHPDAS